MDWVPERHSAKRPPGRMQLRSLLVFAQPFLEDRRRPIDRTLLSQGPSSGNRSMSEASPSSLPSARAARWDRGQVVLLDPSWRRVVDDPVETDIAKPPSALTRSK
jgi:hypothetical protein